MPTPPVRPRHPLAAFIVRESTVLTVIVLNAVVLFLDAFPVIHARTEGVLFAIDYGCMVFFVVEAALKIREGGFAAYWRRTWNKFDFVIVLAGLPLLAAPFVQANLDIFAVILLGRIARFLRVMQFIPNATEIGSGILRALKASVGIFLVLFVLNLLLAMGANLLFGEVAPEYFGNPLMALYSLFKVFTIEGWYEIPEHLARRGDVSAPLVTLLRLYFAGSVLIGGILGLSLANAIFVDEMTVDNTAKLEAMVERLQADLAERDQAMHALLTDVQRRLDDPGGGPVP